jgi:hypothetical protein
MNKITIFKYSNNSFNQIKIFKILISKLVTKKLINLPILVSLIK